MKDVHCSVVACLAPHHRGGFCRNHHYRFKKYGNPMMGNPAPGSLSSWIDAHKNYAGSDCLMWPFHRSPDGYARHPVNGRDVNVHSTMCAHRHGPRPSDKHHAAHICGNGVRGCVNPQHMEWKTPKENEADKKIHGTVLRGEKHHKTTIGSTDVENIRDSNFSQRKLAELYDVSQSTIWRIRQRLTWRHVL